MTTRFHSMLQKKIEEAIQVRSVSVLAGACTDYARYMENVGYVIGLTDCLKLCDDVEQDLGNERGDPT